MRRHTIGTQSYLELTGRPDEAVLEAKRAQELDPLSLIINTSFGDRLFSARQYDRAIEQLRSTIEIDPNFIDSHGSLGEVYLQQKLYDQAIAEFQKAKQAENSAWASAKIGQVYAMSGKTADARRIIAELEEQLKRGAASPDYIAGIYARLGEKEQALAWLERAYEARSDLLVFIKVDPTWDEHSLGRSFSRPPASHRASMMIYLSFQNEARVAINFLPFQ